jgi:hypothetical protein
LDPRAAHPPNKLHPKTEKQFAIFRTRATLVLIPNTFKRNFKCWKDTIETDQPTHVADDESEMNDTHLTLDEIKTEFGFVTSRALENRGANISPDALLRANDHPTEKPIVGYIKQSVRGDFALGKGLMDFLSLKEYRDRAYLALGTGGVRDPLEPIALKPFAEVEERLKGVPPINGSYGPYWWLNSSFGLADDGEF